MTYSNDASPPHADSPRSDGPSGSPDLTPWTRPVLKRYGTVEDLTRGPGSGNIDALLGGPPSGFQSEEPTFS